MKIRNYPSTGCNCGMKRLTVLNQLNSVNKMSAKLIPKTTKMMDDMVLND